MKVSLTSMKKTVLALATASILVSCATSPTGRSQLIIFPDSQLNEMGEQAFSSMKSDIKISNQRVENALVQCIANELLEFVPSSVFEGEWEVVVFDDAQVNAFALPGGKIGVYTGLLGVAVNQHQVAAVVGHEIGHVIARHGNERMSQSAAASFTQQGIAAILQSNEVAQTPLIMQGLGLATQLGTLSYSRDHETEADIIGLDLMARAGFQPQESVELWKNMAANSSGEKPPEFLSTHPAESTRIKNLSANMPAATKLYNNAANKADCS